MSQKKHSLNLLYTNFHSRRGSCIYPVGAFIYSNHRVRKYPIGRLAIPALNEIIQNLRQGQKIQIVYESFPSHSVW